MISWLLSFHTAQSRTADVNPLRNGLGKTTHRDPA